MSASVPGKKNAAATMPCFSAVAQIGSPPHHEPSPASSLSR